MSRVLVIGGSGFLGLNIVDELLRRGYQVRVTRRRSTPTMFLRKRSVELVNASLEEPDALRRAMDGCEAVMLAGAHYPRYSLERDASIENGVRGVRNACDAAIAARVERFVFTSSIGTLDAAPAGRLADERDIAPAMPGDSVYRAAKWAMEREVDRATKDGLPAVTLLPGGCLGPWDLRVGTSGILLATVRRALPWWTDGIANLVDVTDVARAHVAALGAPIGARYCVAGHAVSLRALLERIVARYGGAFPDASVPHDEARARADREEREAAPRRARVPFPRELVDLLATGQPIASTRAHRELGIDLTPLLVTLDRAHDWFVRFRYLPRPDEQPRSHHDHL